MRICDRRFVAVSGLPGSGKSALAVRLAPMLGLPVIDKDDVLERLFDSRGVGDATWRRSLSREADLIFRREAEASAGAILVSHWHLTGMPADSGTPADWLANLSNRVVNLHCECPSEVAAERFILRRRHSGHLDHERSRAEIQASIRDQVRFDAPNIGQRVSVNTSAPIELEVLVARISRAFGC